MKGVGGITRDDTVRKNRGRITREDRDREER